jgi:hypothetical protein
MARFKVTGPDGKSFAIEAPDADTAGREADAFFAQQQPSIGSTAADSLIGAGSGITDQAIATAELPANLATGARWLADKAGVPQDLINKGASIGKSVPILGQALQASQNIRSEMDNPTTALGKGIKDYRNYKPTTQAGKFSKSIGSFAGGAIGPKAGLLTRVGKYVVAPGVASEGAAQLAEGTALEPYARAVGGLAGLGGGAWALNSGANVKGLKHLGETAFKNSLDKADDVEKLGTQAFNMANRSGIHIKSATMDDISQQLDDYLADPHGVNWIPGATPKATAVFDHLNNSVLKTSRGIGWKGAPATVKTGNQPLTFMEMNTLIKVLGKQAKKLPYTEKEDARILWAAKHFLEDKLQALKVKDVYGGSGGNLNMAKQALSDAKRYWTKKSKLDLLDQMETKAGQTGQARFTRGGEEHATRTEFLNFLRKDPNKRQSLTKDELKAFENTAKGDFVTNTARNFGKQIAGFGGLSGAGTGAWLGGLATHTLPGMLAGAGTTLALTQLAKTLAKRGTRRSANTARALIAQDGKKPKRGYISNLSRLLTGNQIVND